MTLTEPSIITLRPTQGGRQNRGDDDVWVFALSAVPDLLSGQRRGPRGSYSGNYDSEGVMMHDCAITAHYTIFPDLPLVFDFDKLLKGESMIGWEPENGCRIGVVPRFGSDDSIRWFEIEESFLFHVANAWEDGEEIVLQACRSDRGAIETSADQDVREQLGRLHEWRLNLTTGAVSSKLLLANDYCDFPRIQDDLVGYQNRFTLRSPVSSG